MANPTSSGRGAYASLTHRPAKSETDNALDDEPPNPRRGPWSRLDTTHLLILILGSAMLLLALIALGVLWKESMRATAGEDPREPWVRVFSENRSASFVTICTAIIRTSMGFQASMVTAMLAGIILELIGVPFLQAPFFSILRALHVSPNNLLSSAMFRSKGLFSWLIYTLIITEVLVTIASQFLSTILVSDFAEGAFANLSNSTAIKSNWATHESPSNLSPQKWWQVPITSTWAFAEHSEEAVGGPTFHDTGATYRAFLPFEAEAQRATLRRFSGPALVMNQRVVCGKPSLSNLSRDGAYAGLRVSGKAGMDPKSFPRREGQEAEISYNKGPTSFNCEVPMGQSRTRMGDTSLCFPGGIGNMSLKDPFLDSNDGDMDAQDDFFSMETFLILDLLSGDALIEEEDLRPTADRGDGSWAIVTTRLGTEALRVTACSTRLDARALEVEMVSNRERVEPTIQWDSEAGTYNVTQVMHQLGASPNPENHENRDILKLIPEATWWRRDYSDQQSLASGFFISGLVRGMPERTIVDIDSVTNQSVRLTAWGDEALVNDAHVIYATLFESTLSASGSPALAAQVLLARIHQMAYYSEIPRQPATAIASTSFSVSAQVPSRWTGFIAVTCLITMHFVVITVVVALFLCRTRHSLIGNHWQAVSQIVSEETLQLLEQADGIEDKDLKSQAESQSVDMSRPTILRRRDDGRIALGAGC